MGAPSDARIWVKFREKGRTVMRIDKRYQPVGSRDLAPRNTSRRREAVDGRRGLFVASLTFVFSLETNLYCLGGRVCRAWVGRPAKPPSEASTCALGHPA